MLRALPSFAGTWQGTYAITGCQQSGFFTDIAFCDSFPAGSVLDVQLQMSQTDDRVTGSVVVTGYLAAG